MKICWDNLEGFRLIKNKFFRKGTNTYIYVTSCSVCGEPYLTEKTRPSNTCSSSCSLKGRKHSKEFKARMSKNNSGKGNPNYKGGVKFSKFCIFDTYSDKIALCEPTRRSPTNNTLLEVKCSVCGRWFLPKQFMVISRVRAINSEPGGVGAFYCSDLCKSKCSMYRKSKWSAGYNPRPYRNNEFFTDYAIGVWSKEVLKRANYKCEYCGEKAKHAHHIEPKKLAPGLALDPENGLACCVKCHYKYGHKDECSSSSLSKRVCN